MTAAPGGPGERVVRVGVNLLWLVPGVVGGSEEYLVGSLLALARHPAPDVAVTVLGLDRLASAHPELADAFPFVALRSGGARKWLRVGAEQTWLAAQTSRRHLEVVHHGGGVVPLVHPGRVVLTVHDLQPLEFPERFSRTKRAYLAAMLPRSVRAADVLVTTSAWVRSSVVDRLGADPARCHVVAPVVGPTVAATPAAAPPAVAKPTATVTTTVASTATTATTATAGARRDGLARADRDAVRLRHGIGPRYLLYPAITYQHKNHRVLLDALCGLRDGPTADVELVLCGGPGDAEADVAARITQAGLAGRVHRLGRVSRAELDALLAGALALVFPSRYEGFGLPVVEAMAAGTPVVAAANTALKEVVGSGGMLVPTDDVGAWQRAIIDLASQPRLRDQLVAAGRARAAAFGPEQTAAALAGAYRAAARRAASHSIAEADTVAPTSAECAGCAEPAERAARAELSTQQPQALGPRWRERLPQPWSARWRSLGQDGSSKPAATFNSSRTEER